MAAPKGNRFALGLNTSGRPPIYETHEQLIQKAAEYFEMETNTTGVCKPTISGLTYHLGFASRSSLYNYKEKSEEFLYTINSMIQFIESCYEKNLHGFAWAGSCFALKNINSKDWKDEVTQNQNQVVTKVEIIEKKRDA